MEVDLFSDSLRDDSSLFLPVSIEWETMAAFQRQYIEAWMEYSISWYSDPDSDCFFSYFTEPGFNARNFFTFSHDCPLLTEEVARFSEKEIKIIRFQRSAFSKFAYAAQHLSSPDELLRFFCFFELYLNTDAGVYSEINNYKAGGHYPFARAVYSLVTATPFFNYPRRFQQVNRIRYVRIFNSDSYTYGNLSYLNMGERAFQHAAKEANFLAEHWCSGVTGILKSLGYTVFYIEDGCPDGNFKKLAGEINSREHLYLPAAFYKHLFKRYSNNTILKTE